MVSMAMMVMMAAEWKRLVAVAEVVVTGVAMAAATHLACYHWWMTRLSWQWLSWRDQWRRCIVEICKGPPTNVRLDLASYQWR
jgi:hypothetical protein